MAGDTNLKLSIAFSALDKLSGPIERMRQGTRGLASDMAKTRKTIKALGDAQKLLENFKAQDAGYKKRATELEAARKATAKLRAEIASSDAPTIKMRKNLEAAEKQERALTQQHEKQGAALKELSGKLNAAGVDVGQMAEHEARLTRQMGEANAAMERQQTRAAKMGAARERGERLQATGGKVALAGAGMTAGISVPTIALLRESVAAAAESRDAINQVRASLASMGNASQRTLPQLEAQAEALMRLSTFDDDEIMRGVTTSLTTFDAISGPIFDRAQTAAVNLSAKFGKDLQGSAMMIGKALQNPLKGLTALTKIGVSFTAAQKAQITAMATAGNIAGAQAIVLGELERQTNGAAKAARDAAPDASLKNSWDELQEKLGEIALTKLSPLFESLTKLLDAFNNLSPGTQSFIVGLLLAAVVLGPLVTLLGGLMTIVGAVAAAMAIGFLPALGVILAVVAVVGLLAYAGYQIYQNWSTISAFFSGLWDQVYAAFTGPLGSILTVLFPFLGIPIKIYEHWGAISGFFSSVWDGIKAGIDTALAFFSELPGKFGGFGSAIVQGLINAMPGGALASHLLSIAKSGLDAFKNFFGIKSPSRVFMGLGGHITDGLAMGLDRGGKQPLRSLARITAGLTGGAALAIASPSFASAAGGAGGGGTASTSAARSITYNVTIQLASTGDAKADAGAIKRELDALLAVEARGSYLDG